YLWRRVAVLVVTLDPGGADARHHGGEPRAVLLGLGDVRRGTDDPPTAGFERGLDPLVEDVRRRGAVAGQDRHGEGRRRAVEPAVEGAELEALDARPQHRHPALG